MKSSASIFVPFAGLVLIVFATQFMAPKVADARHEATPQPVVVTPFEYYPAQFVMYAPEPGPDFPTF